MKHRVITASGNYAATLSQEDGKTIRGWHQEMAPVIKHVSHLRDMGRYKRSGHWEHLGSIPMTIIQDWLLKNGYTFRQWAVNAGGIKGKVYPESQSGVKDKFLKYFSGREFNKFHNLHHTTRRKRSWIDLPSSVTRGAVDLEGIGQYAGEVEAFHRESVQ